MKGYRLPSVPVRSFNMQLGRKALQYWERCHGVNSTPGFQNVPVLWWRGDAAAAPQL
jgi:hypothetical protein